MMFQKLYMLVASQHFFQEYNNVSLKSVHFGEEMVKELCLIVLSFVFNFSDVEKHHPEIF